ncbi:hypothetical protein [Alsobacter sp. R-9]
MSVITLRRVEREHEVGASRKARAAIAAALEAAGVIFLPENGEGVGVRLRKPGGAP